MWRFEEGSGEIAADSGVGGHAGILTGNVAFVDDADRGSVLEFGSGESYVDTEAWITEMGDAHFSIAAWIQTGQQGAAIVGKSNGDRDWSFHEKQFYLSTGSEQGAPVAGGVHFYGNQAGEIWGATEVDSGKWQHVCATWNNVTDEQHIYVDGKLDDLSPVWVYYGGRGDLPDDTVRIGFDCSGNATSDFTGRMDDVAIFDVTLTAEQVSELMNLTLPVTASNVSPEDGTTDVPLQEVVLDWNAGVYAHRHDVYFGLDADPVANADRTNPLSVLVSENQSQNRYPPDDTLVLDFGTTYYWRIDEVNAAPDFTQFKGEVWSFTTEPVAIPVTGITATASSSFEGSGPEKTIDGSGLVEDLHGTIPGDMWISQGIPATIDYAFDRAYKLHQLGIWNANQDFEAFLGFGAKDIVIEHSLDGENWTVLEGVGPLDQAPGRAGLASGNTIEFGGVLAQRVRLTINSAYGFLPQTSLSEVRFYAIPVSAREPQPVDGGSVLSLDTILKWRAGREADTHEVGLSRAPAALADGTAVTGITQESNYTPDTLNYGATYYWQVIEVNAVGTPSRHEGPIWRFTTPDTLTVDNFESYADKELLEIWATWADGYENPSNGAIVGNGNDAETSIVYEGAKSMPITYDNSAAAVSEATRTFDPVLDWTAGAPTNFSLYLRGIGPGGALPANTAQAVYAVITDSAGRSATVSYKGGDATATLSDEFEAWIIPLADLAPVDLGRVKSITIGIGTPGGAPSGATGTLYVDLLAVGV